jgi:poly(3-hydroxybutyrate) depolymerase
MYRILDNPQPTQVMREGFPTAHGMGVGGQMAFYLGFNKRDLFRGVATTGAALGSNPKERVANQPLSFFVVAGGKDPLKDGPPPYLPSPATAGGAPARSRLSAGLMVPPPTSEAPT